MKNPDPHPMTKEQVVALADHVKTLDRIDELERAIVEAERRLRGYEGIGMLYCWAGEKDQHYLVIEEILIAELRRQTEHEAYLYRMLRACSAYQDINIPRSVGSDFDEHVKAIRPRDPAIERVADFIEKQEAQLDQSNQQANPHAASSLSSGVQMSAKEAVSSIGSLLKDWKS